MTGLPATVRRYPRLRARNARPDRGDARGGSSLFPLPLHITHDKLRRGRLG